MESFGEFPEEGVGISTTDFKSMWLLVKKRSKYYIPILSWLPRYDIKAQFAGDFAAGLTSALLIIPQSLSYSISLCRLPPILGLYSSLFPLLIYGILGSSRQLSVGPEALISLLIGNAVLSNLKPVNSTATSSFNYIDQPNFNSFSLVDEKMTIVATLSLLVGLFTLFIGLARLGFMDSVILSRPLLRGFVTAVACVIFIEQLGDLLGVTEAKSPEDQATESPFGKLIDILSHAHKINWVTFAISSSCFIFLFGVAWLKRKIRRMGANAYMEDEEQNWLLRPSSASLQGYGAIIDHERSEMQTSLMHRLTRFLVWLTLITPEILVVVVTTILVSHTAKLYENYGVVILGTKTSGSGPSGGLEPGFMPIVYPDLNIASFKALVMPALLISVLGFVESTVAAKNYALKYQYTVSPNRELVAFGALNIVGSLLNCFPVFASLPRSQLNDQAGAKSQLSGVITSIGVLFTVWIFVGVFWWVPVSVLASVVCVAAFGLLEFDDVYFMMRIRAWFDISLMILMFCLTIFVSVEAGVLCSITLSLLLVVKQTTKVKVSVLVKVPEISRGEGDGTEPNSPQASPTRIKYKYKPLEEVHQYQLDNSKDPSRDILVVKIEEALFFGNSGQLMDRLRRAEAYNGYLHTHPSEEATRQIKPEPLDDQDTPPSRTPPENIKRPQLSWLNPAASSFGSNFRPASSAPGRFPSVGNTNDDAHDDNKRSPHRFTAISEEYPLRKPASMSSVGITSNRFKNHLIKVNLDGAEHDVEEEDVSTNSILSDEDADRGFSLHSSLANSYLRGVIFDIENMPSIDPSALHALHHIVESYQSRDIGVCFVKMRESVKQTFVRSGLLGDVLGSEWFFRKIGDAELYLRQRLRLDTEHGAEEGFSSYNVL